MNSDAEKWINAQYGGAALTAVHREELHAAMAWAYFDAIQEINNMAAKFAQLGAADAERAAHEIFLAVNRRLPPNLRHKMTLRGAKEGR